MRRRPTALAAAFDTRLGLALISVLSLASAAVSGVLAGGHMVLRAAICGQGATAHCGWCAATAGFTAMAAVAAAAAALSASQAG